MTDIDTYSEAWRAQCEAADWLSRIREQKPVNRAHGQQMLDQILEDIAKKRGQPAADSLRGLIEIERSKK